MKADDGAKVLFLAYFPSHKNKETSQKWNEQIYANWRFFSLISFRWFFFRCSSFWSSWVGIFELETSSEASAFFLVRSNAILDNFFLRKIELESFTFWQLSNSEIGD